MATPPYSPTKPLTAQEIYTWLLATAERHATVHLEAAQLRQGQNFYGAFADMSVLFLEAFEEVRVVSAQLREESQGSRSRSIALREHYAQLLEQSVATMERLGQFLPPAPEEVR